MSHAQCSRCDAAADCIAQNLNKLEDVADVLGVPTPSLHVHLVQHNRDDLLRDLTYGGEPIIPPKVEETTVLVQQTSPEIVTPFDPEAFQIPVPSNDGQTAGEHDKSVGVAAEPASEAQGDDTNPEALSTPDVDVEDGIVLDDYPPDHEIEAVLEWLAGHEDPAIGGLARDLIAALEDHAQHAMDRARLEQLITQRDQLTTQIDQITARLHPAPAMTAAAPEPRHPLADAPRASEVRVWCHANDVPCPTTGRIPHSAVDAYQAAHAGGAA